MSIYRRIRDLLMSAPTADLQRLTVKDIDEVLRHWSAKLHTDPDPLNRWAYLNVADAWLDARLRLRELDGIREDNEQNG